MPKISMSLSYTFQPGSNQWCKANFEVHEIDTELPLEGQMEDVERVSEEVWRFLRNKVDVKVGEIYDAANKGKNGDDS